MTRFLGCLLVCGLILLPACGGGDASITTTISVGPLTIALPFVPTAVGEVLTVGLRNLADTPATVHVTARAPTGVAYLPGTVPVALPAQGGMQLPLATFTGAVRDGGWIEVETRDPAVLDPVTGEPTPTATSGYVAAYLRRDASGVRQDAALGAAFREDRAYVTLTPDTIAYQLIHRSFDPLAGGAVPVAITVDVTAFAADGTGTAVGTFPLGANGSEILIPPPGTGRLEVVPTPQPAQPAPATTDFRLAIAALEADPQVMIETRFLEIARDDIQQFVGFDLEFGEDFAGNQYDFAVLATNAGAVDATLQLTGIYASDGAAILATPRLVALDSMRTKYLTTTTLQSLGLDAFEPSPFDDLFGDVGAATGFQSFTVVFSVPPGVDVSARGFSPAKSFYRILPGRKLTTDVMVAGLTVEPTTTSDLRNLVTAMNPRDTSVTANIRGYTPGGTEYLLDPIVVPPYGRFEWSPDGRVFREDPTDTVGPGVPFMAFRMTGLGGLFFNSRRDRRDVNDLIISVTPQVVRDLRED